MQFAAQQRPLISPISDCKSSTDDEEPADRSWDGLLPPLESADESIAQLSSQSLPGLCPEEAAVADDEEVDEIIVSQRIAVETFQAGHSPVRFLEASDAQLFALYASQDYPVEEFHYSTGEGRGIRTTRDIGAAGEVLADYHGQKPVMTAAEFEKFKQGACMEKLL